MKESINNEHEFEYMSYLSVLYMSQCMCKIILWRTRRPPDRPDPDWSVVVRLRLFGADDLFGRDNER